MKSEDDKAKAILQKTEFFKHLTDGSITSLSQIMSSKTFKKGEVIAREDASPTKFFIVEAGTIQRFSKSIQVDTVYPKQISGFLHIFDDNSKTFATLEAGENNTITWEISKEPFLDILSKDSDLSLNLIKYLSENIRMNSKILRAFQTSEKEDKKQNKEKKFSIVFFDAKEYDKKFFELENEKRGREFYLKFVDERLNNRTIAYAIGFDAICVFVNDRVTDSLVSTLSTMDISLVLLRCAGFNQIAVETCKSFKITCARVPSYSPSAVAEHAVALILTLNRKIHRAHLRTSAGNFKLDGLLGFNMKDKVIGVIGTGQIGTALIEILHNGFKCQILCYDIVENSSIKSLSNAKYVSLDTLLSQSDIISLHLPLNKHTKYIIDSIAIQKMKHNVMLINTGRGALIDSRALVDGLKEGKIGAAGLDVYENEEGYFFEDKSEENMKDDILARLMSFKNVIVTGHQAFFTEDALKEIAKTTLDNARDFKEGKTGKDHKNNVWT